MYIYVYIHMRVCLHTCLLAGDPRVCHDCAHAAHVLDRLWHCRRPLFVCCHQRLRLSHLVDCVAVCCSVLQCVAVYRWPLFVCHHKWLGLSHWVECVAVCCNMLQCVAVCCMVLQGVKVRCSVLQCVAVSCSVLQCVSMRCSALQCVAVYRQPPFVRLSSFNFLNMNGFDFSSVNFFQNPTL